MQNKHSYAAFSGVQHPIRAGKMIWSIMDCVLAVSVMQQISPHFGEQKVKACAEQVLTGVSKDKLYPWEQDQAQVEH